MKQYILEFISSLALDEEITTDQWLKIKKIILEVLNENIKTRV